VTLVSALSDDPAGRSLRRLLRERGVRVIELGLAAATPEKVRVRAGSRSLVRVDRGGGPPQAIGPTPAAARAAIGWAAAVLVADYGRGLAAQPSIDEALRHRCAAGAAVVWDPHPRGPRPVPGVTLATPNRAEAARFTRCERGPFRQRAEALRARWQARWLAVTLGADGAELRGQEGHLFNIAAPAVEGGDPCGAGDCFASSAAGALADGCDVPTATRRAVSAASAFVARGGAVSLSRFSPAPSLTTPEETAESFARRSTGGRRTVVATGGCFDLLHAGHVATLRAARALGDALVVCVNSDASVRRLKGSGRPLVPLRDRVAVLEALDCVDQVVAFEEDTPEAALEQIRPDVWAKGGDYRGVELAEAAQVGRWGGRAVVLPYLDGRSTTAIIEEAAHRAG
jgi:rfaE bifunctional protein nucleotidyltransferase chain/domain